MDNLPQWLQFGAFGLLVIILTAGGFFFIKFVWPFITKQLEDNQKYIREQADKSDRRHSDCEDNIKKLSMDFTSALNKQVDLTRKIAEDFSAALDQIRRQHK